MTHVAMRVKTALNLSSGNISLDALVVDLGVGEKALERDHWYFPCHFKSDEVMAGSLVSDGCSQLLKLYMDAITEGLPPSKLPKPPEPPPKPPVEGRPPPPKRSTPGPGRCRSPR